MTEIVKLNIGGVHYETTRGTLVNKGENFFSSLLSGRIPSLQDADGRYFVDRNGRHFEPILQFLRTGELSLAQPGDLRAILREADFYNINIQEVVGQLHLYIEIHVQNQQHFTWAQCPFDHELEELRQEFHLTIGANDFARILTPQGYYLTSILQGKHDVCYLFERRG